VRRFEKKEVTRQHEYLVEQTCDLCGAVAKHPDAWGDTGGSYGVDETEIKVTVRQKEGDSYPDGGSGTEFHVDICPNCFKTRLVPWLLSQGAKIEEKEWEW
jgi:hypothetical protein